MQDYKVTVMFSAPTAIRVLKKQDAAYSAEYDISSLRHLFLAGEPLDEPTANGSRARSVSPSMTTTGRRKPVGPLLPARPGSRKLRKFGSPSFPAYGYDVRLLQAGSGQELGANQKGVVCVVPPLPPGCMSTVWGQDDRFHETYFTNFPGRLIYTTFDWGIRDDDGYYFILGRTDDVINVAGHRLGTREIEEAICSHPAIAEVAVVGVADEVKGQVPLAFAVVKDAAATASPESGAGWKGSHGMRGRSARSDRPTRCGTFCNPASQDPLGESAAALHQGVAEGHDPGDLTTLDDPLGMEQIQMAC